MLLAPNSKQQLVVLDYDFGALLALLLLRDVL